MQWSLSLNLLTFEWEESFAPLLCMRAQLRLCLAFVWRDQHLVFLVTLGIPDSEKYK